MENMPAPAISVSVLFSEPKISQLPCAVAGRESVTSFSALQRAENFSRMRSANSRRTHPRFSALQRAENFSIAGHLPENDRWGAFQCSSASRKFLKCGGRSHFGRRCWFQCSSASRKFLNLRSRLHRSPLPRVSVLFSEPKISQSDPRTCIHPYSRPR